MRRSVGVLGVALLVAALTPVMASASPASVPHRAAAATSPAWTLGGAKCSLIDVPAADGTRPVGIGTCPGVRPGAIVQTEVGLCTLNFLFTTPDGERFIGTAGHCILGEGGPTGDNAGEKTWPKGQGPEAKDSTGHRIGEFAYAILQDPKDFSLIRLDPGVKASPELCDFGGPTGINDDIGAGTRTLEYWGNGIGIGSVLPARSAIADGFPNADHVYALGLALPGDSGSAVITDDGRAVGVLVTTGVHGFGYDQNGLDFGTMGITRLAPQLAQASKVLGLKLSLVTAK
ncbi:MAG TPA: hypothetical protein VHL53_21935 [Acidimicrobiia bacterium]|nr:hypothetical protein [Acidimicrobiia bacterium]